MKRKQRKVTLVLGGGSARGIAHIGVLRVLEREKIPIDRIVGTSMGALIGAAYSLGIPMKEMEDKAYGFSVNKLLDPTFRGMGILAGDRLENMIRNLIDSRTFTDCKIPLAIVTTDIESGDRDRPSGRRSDKDNPRQLFLARHIRARPAKRKAL